MPTKGQTYATLGVNVATALASVILLIFSFTQIEQRTRTSIGTYITGPSNNSDYACSDPDSIWAQHRPIQIQWEFDTQSLFCPWPVANSAIRITAHLLALIVLGLNIFLVLGRRNVTAFWILEICMMCVFGLEFYVIISDGQTVSAANNFCTENRSNFVNKNPMNPEKLSLDCQMGSCIFS
eukprot:TRINITY_DN1069_c0_g1_i4.p1 TRINITY_DN1069_c0_g1~~TRINITY_DN1069_c0_g1_i4.p1  ORF type:complete len:181 (+),score=27.34 TRINITY_DN1069_c0_g1_i4:145-687(+)